MPQIKELGQFCNNKGNLLLSLVRPLVTKTKHSLPMRKSSLSLCLPLKKWQSYLQCRHFIIKIDHSSLKYFLNQRANTHFQQKWVSKLLGFDYEIQYIKKRTENLVADAFSRLLDYTLSDHKELEDTTDIPSCLEISYLSFEWLDELRILNESDEWILSKIKELVTTSNSFVDSDNQSKYKVENGFLKYKSWILLNLSSPWRSKIMYEHHNTPASGHTRVFKTYQRIKKGFCWPG